MAEKRKLAKNTSNQIQIVNKSGKSISVMPGEVIAADAVTNGKGILFEGFEFLAEVSVYSPKAISKKLNRGDMKVPFDGFLKEKTTKGMGKKTVKKTAKKAKKKVAKKTSKKVAKKATKKIKK